jgi:hypothetical protein
MMQVVVIWIRRGKAYIPTQAQTEAGYFMGIEPIYIAELTKDDLKIALEKTLAAGHPKVATPTRDDLLNRKDPLLKAAKVRSWKEFERNAIAFGVTWTTDTIILDIGNESTKFQNDPERQRKFPFTTPLSTIIEIILAEIKSRPELFQ